LPICFDCDEYEWGITIHTKCIKKNWINLCEKM
jgi:hypothetical protein